MESHCADVMDIPVTVEVSTDSAYMYYTWPRETAANITKLWSQLREWRLRARGQQL